MLTEEQISYLEDIRDNHPEVDFLRLVQMLQGANWSEQMIREALEFLSETTPTDELIIAASEESALQPHEAGSDIEERKKFILGLSLILTALVSVSIYGIYRLLDHEPVSTLAIDRSSAALSYELVDTVVVPGTITGPYQSISKAQLLSDGTLAYRLVQVNNDDLIYEIDDFAGSPFYIGNTAIAGKDWLSPVYEIAGEPAYLEESASFSSFSTLIYQDERFSPDTLISDVTDVGGKLAYVYREPEGSIYHLIYDGQEVDTSSHKFSLVKDVGGSLAYIKVAPTESNELSFTLYFNGNKIETTGTPKDIDLIAGHLVYTTQSDVENNAHLYIDNSLHDSAKQFINFAEIGGLLTYQKASADRSIELIQGDQVIATSSVMPFLMKEVNGKLAYTQLDLSSKNLTHTLYYDGKVVASTSVQMGWARIVGETITDFFEINGHLCYIISDEDVRTASLSCDNATLFNSHMIGTSPKTPGTEGSSAYDTMYFYTAEETEGSTTFSIYRLK